MSSTTRTWAVQEFMRQDAAPLEGVFVEWHLRWRLTSTRLELEKEPAAMTAAQAAALKLPSKESMRANIVKAQAARWGR